MTRFSLVFELRGNKARFILQKFFPSEMVDLSGFPGSTAEDTTSPESLQVSAFS